MLTITRLARLALSGVVSATMLLSSCSKDGDAGSGPGPVCTDCTPTGMFTARLPSPPGVTLWTAPTMEKILREAAPPATPTDRIALYAARNEFEPFQVAVNAAASGSVSLAMTPFTGPGTIDRIEVRRAGYVKITQPSDASSIPSGYIPDPLEPASFNTPESVSAGQNQVLPETQWPAHELAWIN